MKDLVFVRYTTGNNFSLRRRFIRENISGSLCPFNIPILIPSHLRTGIWQTLFPRLPSLFSFKRKTVHITQTIWFAHLANQSTLAGSKQHPLREEIYVVDDGGSIRKPPSLVFLLIFTLVFFGRYMRKPKWLQHVCCEISEREWSRPLPAVAKIIYICNAKKPSAGGRTTKSTYPGSTISVRERFFWDRFKSSNKS